MGIKRCCIFNEAGISLTEEVPCYFGHDMLDEVVQLFQHDLVVQLHLGTGGAEGLDLGLEMPADRGLHGAAVCEVLLLVNDLAQTKGDAKEDFLRRLQFCQLHFQQILIISNNIEVFVDCTCWGSYLKHGTVFNTQESDLPAGSMFFCLQQFHSTVFDVLYWDGLLQNGLFLQVTLGH